MISRTLKKLSDLGYAISSIYEPCTNEIVIRLEKGTEGIEKRFGFNNAALVGSSSFEFYVDRCLIDILDEISKTKKGEESND